MIVAGAAAWISGTCVDSVPATTRGSYCSLGRCLVGSCGGFVEETVRVSRDPGVSEATLLEHHGLFFRCDDCPPEAG